MQANKADTKPIVHVGKALVLIVLDQASPRLEEHFLLGDLLSHSPVHNISSRAAAAAATCKQAGIKKNTKELAVCLPW